jgi:hypothetical protein
LSQLSDPSDIYVWASKSVETAQCTLAGIEFTHMLRKGQWAGGAEQGLIAAEQFYALAA